MSQIVETPLGRCRRVVNRDGGTWWLWECPQCKQWTGMSDEQWGGRVSVACDCGYHQTHDYGKALAAAVVAAGLTGHPLSTEEQP